MDPVWWAVAGVYLVIPLGIVLFALPQSGSTPQAALRGFAFGLVLYAVYELTNLSLVRDWPAAMAAVDIVWGGVICAVVTTAAHVLSGRLS